MLEGRKRQIRRVAALLGHPVMRLVRTHIGQLGLGTLRKGAWYQLDEDEIGRATNARPRTGRYPPRPTASANAKPSARRGQSSPCLMI